MARFLEENDVLNKENEESLSPSEAGELSSPRSAETKDNKIVKKGRLVTCHG